MNTMPRKLTHKQALFVKEYVATKYNATKAAQAAYNSYSYGSARVIGSKLLTNANVQQAIQAELIKHDITADIMAERHRELLNSKNRRVALDALKLAYKVYIGLER
jgi:phage terminase small subunit